MFVCQSSKIYPRHSGVCISNGAEWWKLPRIRLCERFDEVWLLRWNRVLHWNESVLLEGRSFGAIKNIMFTDSGCNDFNVKLFFWVGVGGVIYLALSFYFCRNISMLVNTKSCWNNHACLLLVSFFSEWSMQPSSGQCFPCNKTKPPLKQNSSENISEFRPFTIQSIGVLKS